VRTERAPDPATLIEQLHSWVGDDGFVRCLSDNPRALLGFGDALDDSRAYP
jgi:hypothetical protein